MSLLGEKENHEVSSKEDSSIGDTQEDTNSWRPEKYKNDEEWSKGHRELELRLGSAPSQYDFSKAEEWLDPSYEPIQKMAEYAKSRHVPQDVLDNFFESVGSFVKERGPNHEVEMSKLGENAQERLNVLDNWAKSNLSEKAYKALTAENGILSTAESIEALEEIRSKSLSNSSMIPNSNGATAASSYTIDDWRAELQANFAEMNKNPALYAAHQKKLAKIKS